MTTGCWAAPAATRFAATCSVGRPARFADMTSGPASISRASRAAFWAMLAIPALACTTAGALNYSGFCIKEGRHLSDEEKIANAIHDILDQYPPAVIRKEISQGVYHRSPPPNPIAYRGLEDFFALNPGCCRIVISRGNEGGPPTRDIGGPPDFWSRVTGGVSAYVEVLYRVRYRTSGGEEHSERVEATPAISNCGNTLDL